MKPVKHKVVSTKRTHWKRVNIHQLPSLKLNRDGHLLLAQNQGAYNYRSEMGRSSCTILCGICGLQNDVYVWSLAGSGKRCDNCNSLIATGVTFAEVDLNIPEGVLECIELND